METIKEMIVREKRYNVILYLILLMLCIFNIILNVDTYKKVLYDSYDKINKLEDINQNHRFMTFDLTNAKKENYIIDFNNEKLNIYTLNIDNQNILILLKNNTLITDKVTLQKFNNENIIKNIKLKFKDKNYYDVVFSNINYNFDRKIELYKIYILSFFIVISLILLVKNLIQMINPTNTSLYKRKIKEYNIN